ncbi:MAG: hypothetical protein IPK83_07165 [Planctomycetes bacterium]|nr:hypothetical protein [Planctomycetota bacterium]
MPNFASEFNNGDRMRFVGRINRQPNRRRLTPPLMHPRRGQRVVLVWNVGIIESQDDGMFDSACIHWVFTLAVDRNDRADLFCVGSSQEHGSF